jgi:hypothetical protein
MHGRPKSLGRAFVALFLASAACGAPPSNVGNSASDKGDPAATPPPDGGAQADTSLGDGAVDAKDSGVRAPGDAQVGPTGFVHPGILVNKAQLDFIKGKVTAGQEPWKSAFNDAQKSRYASATYQATPRATVECGPYSTPDFGCSDEKSDVIAAYTNALLWYFTADESYAKRAVAIMNAWSAVLKEHTNSNAPLQSAWCGSVFPRAAEIIRYTYSGWATPDVARFGAMLKDVYLPEVIKGGSENGNWELSMSEASVAIGVFLDDKATFDIATTMWRKRVPAYLYLSTDGPFPVPPPKGNVTSPQALISFWYKQATFVDGLSQETCRDLGHVQLGLAAMINAAETARIQGVDLYGAESKRITAGLEYQAQYLNGAPVPATLCGGSLNAVSPAPMWEIAYNHYANRAGMTLPQTKTLVGKIRPTGTNHHMVWETLTHAEVGSVGIP